jgi:peptidoglycan/LPS O-acetylase OafA/YrhL
MAVFLMPLSSQNALTDLVSVLGVCPLLVAFGRHSEAKWPALADWLGAISYPLYAIHYPILLLTSHYLGNAPWAGAFGCLTAIGISQAALKFYDEPMRAWARSRRWSLKSPFL